MKILVVDDSNTNLKLLTSMVENLRGCQPLPFLSPAEALAGMPELDFDVAILDYQMPVYNGVEFLTEMLHFEKYASVPIILVTSDLNSSTRMAAIDAGVIDFLNKPIDFAGFKARVQNIAALADARRKHADHVALLKSAGRKMAEAESRDTWSGPEGLEMREQEREIIHRMMLATGYKDAVTARHGQRVAAFAAAIARATGLGYDRCHDIRVAAPMFDMHTTLASDTALLKQGKMTEAGYRKLGNRTSGAPSRSGPEDMPLSLLQLADEIAGSYRERWDGRGYPNRLAGAAIPYAGRLVAVAAGLEALISERPFKTPWPIDQAVAHILGKAGSQFDPDIVAAFEKALHEIRAIAAEEIVPVGYVSA